jgi:hypothetical protein
MEEMIAKIIHRKRIGHKVIADVHFSSSVFWKFQFSLSESKKGS